MNQRTIHSRTRKLLPGLLSLLTATALLASFVGPATAATPGALPCHRTGGIVVSCDVAAMCWTEGGEIRGDGLRAYCCKTTGTGGNKITVCDEVDQLIDIDFIQKAPPKGTRPFGAPSRFQRR